MDNFLEEKKAWLTSNTPNLWAFVNRQQPPFAHASEVSNRTEAQKVPPDSLKDILHALPLSADCELHGDVRIVEAVTEQCESQLLASLKNWVVQHPASDFLLVLYAKWIFIPAHHTVVQLSDESKSSHKFWRLPVLTLGGVTALQKCFERETTFRPGRVDCVLLQSELLQGKTMSCTDVCIENRWSNDLSVCLGLPALFSTQRQQLESMGLKELYRLSREAQEPLALCQALGCAFDCEAHSSLVSMWKVRLQNYESELKTIFRGTNIASNQQLSQALTLYLQQQEERETLRFWPKTSTKLLKTNVATLKLFRHRPALTNVLDLIVAYRTLLKADNHFGMTLKAHLRGERLHSLYKLNGCVTGRLSSSDPNLQNIPRTPEFRKLFTASCGFSLVIGDFSQIELRMAAVLSRDPEMLNCYRRNADLHRLTACALLNISPAAVTPEQRHMAKAINFGTLYGQGAKGLAKYCRANYEVTISDEEAQKYISKFREKFRTLREWQEKILAAREAATPLGRKRSLKGLRDNEKLNMPIQGGAAEVMLLSLIYCHRAVRRLRAFLVNVVHDEVILEVPSESAAKCVETVKSAMNKAFSDYCEYLGVSERWDVADVQSGRDWSCKLVG